MKKKMVFKKEWVEFRATGLTVIINQILHLFGWALVYEMDDDKIKNVYPARIKFRGFDNDVTGKAYRQVSDYMKDNIEDLYKESHK